MAARTLLNPLLLLVVPWVLAGCGGDAGGSAAAEDEAAEIETLDPVTFDTVSWATLAGATDRGSTVYAYSCTKCHDHDGSGTAGYVLNGRVLRPPSFRAESWRFGQDLPGLRTYIYFGNDRGMPHWGAAGLPARDIDAVARYVQRRIWGRI